VKNSKRLIWREKQSLATPPKGRGYKPRRNRGGGHVVFRSILRGYSERTPQDVLGEAAGVRQWPLKVKKQDRVKIYTIHKNILVHFVALVNYTYYIITYFHFLKFATKSIILI